MRSSDDAAPRAGIASPSDRRGRPFVSLRRGFDDVYRRGRRRRVGGVTGIVLEEAGEGPPRVGVVAGRRVGNAVRRNRAKRRLREAVARVPLVPGTTYVLVAAPEVVDAPFDRLVAWVRGAVGLEEQEA